MFNPGEQIINRIKFGVICVGVMLILCLLSVLRYQYNTIINLRSDNKEQAQTLLRYESETRQLKNQAIENQRIMLELSKSEAEIRSESDGVLKSIPKEIKQSDPFNSRAPAAAVEFLRK